MIYLLTGLAVMAGAAAQRVSGMGFALMVAPVLVLLLGPFEGVLMVNLCGAVSAGLVITQVWRRVDWRQFCLLVVPALLAIVPGALLSVYIGGPGLQIVVGVLLVLALTTSLLMRRAGRVTPRTSTGVIAGAASGFMNATAGIGGPAVSVYAVLTRWDPRTFAATLQPYFITIGLVAFTAKVLTSEAGLPTYEWWLWLLVVACTVAGLGIGGILTRRVSAPVIQLTVIVLSYAGALVAIGDGAVTLLR